MSDVPTYSDEQINAAVAEYAPVSEDIDIAIEAMHREIASLRTQLTQIERQMIYRTADMPEWAVAWNKAASGRYCWFVGLHIAQEADNPTPQPAPDLRPDEPGPLWLPIIDALDADEEG